MAYSTQAVFGVLKSIAGSSVTGSYAFFSTLPGTTIVVAFKNETDGDVLVSIDGTNNHLVFPSQSYGTYDVNANAPKSTDIFLRKGMNFFVKAGSTSPSTGNFYLESLEIQVNS